MWTFPTSELIEQASRPTRCPEADAHNALVRVPLLVSTAIELHLCTAVSRAPRTDVRSPRPSSSKADTASPDQPASSSLAINSPPELLGRHHALATRLRPAIGWKPAVP
ncbi:hypothetical protein SVAN01_02036 [Stagonosporopsis vannaccii]|nr:hypothetical protein SVAN01_02036 [Stagonosporopsis vannaccii]